MLELVPRIDRQVCLVLDSDAAASATATATSSGGSKSSSSNDDGADQHALPDVRGWRYDGVQELGLEQTHVWVYEARWVGG